MITAHNPSRNRATSAQRDRRISLMPLEVERNERWIGRAILIGAAVIGVTLGTIFPPF